jgi:hypothetical protein
MSEPKTITAKEARELILKQSKDRESERQKLLDEEMKRDSFYEMSVELTSLRSQLAASMKREGKRHEALVRLQKCIKSHESIAEFIELWCDGGETALDVVNEAVSLSPPSDGGRCGDAAETYHKAILKHLTNFADDEYVRGCNLLRRPECLGWEAKIKAGKFGEAEMNAHKEANLAFGAYQGISAALKHLPLPPPPTQANATSSEGGEG